MASQVHDVQTATVQTTDATQTTILTFSDTPASSVASYHCEVVAFEPATDDAAYYIMRGGWTRPGTGSNTVPGGGGLVRGLDTLEDQAAWDATMSISTNNILVQVTGEASKTIEWFCRLAVTYYDP